jgi:response regulator NasT
VESVLIVSNSEKATLFFTEMLGDAGVSDISAARTCGEARRLLSERDFDLVIVNAVLEDESGERLSRHIASNGSTQVILVVKSEFFDDVSAVCGGDGVFTIAKPINKAVFLSALKLAGAARRRLRRVQNENEKLKQKIADIRIIDRAKCLLISYLGMKERDAHRYIEKQAMDTRSSKRDVAEGILKAYEA